jgi:hypothetical protein
MAPTMFASGSLTRHHLDDLRPSSASIAACSALSRRPRYSLHAPCVQCYGCHPRFHSHSVAHRALPLVKSHVRLQDSTVRLRDVGYQLKSGLPREKWHRKASGSWRGRSSEGRRLSGLSVAVGQRNQDEPQHRRA